MLLARLMDLVQTCAGMVQPTVQPNKVICFFWLHAAKVRSSCEEGPGQSALQSAYHNPQLDRLN